MRNPLFAWNLFYLIPKQPFFGNLVAHPLYQGCTTFYRVLVFESELIAYTELIAIVTEVALLLYFLYGFVVLK